MQNDEEIIRESVSSTLSAADVSRIASEVLKVLQPSLLQPKSPSINQQMNSSIADYNQFSVLDPTIPSLGSISASQMHSQNSLTPSQLPKGLKLSQLDLSSEHYLTGNHYDTHNYADWVYHITMHFSSLSHELFDPVTRLPGVACTAYHLIKNMVTPLQQKYRNVAKTGSGLELWTHLQCDYSGSSSQGQCRALKTVLGYSCSSNVEAGFLAHEQNKSTLIAAWGPQMDTSLVADLVFSNNLPSNFEIQRVDAFTSKKFDFENLKAKILAMFIEGKERGKPQAFPASSSGKAAKALLTTTLPPSTVTGSPSPTVASNSSPSTATRVSTRCPHHPNWPAGSACYACNPCTLCADKFPKKCWHVARSKMCPFAYEAAVVLPPNAPAVSALPQTALPSSPHIGIPTRSFLARSNTFATLDSGSEAHIVANKEVLDIYSTVTNHVIETANGSTMPVLGMGVLRTKSTQEKDVDIGSVLHAPQIAENLLSVSAFDRKGYSSIFHNGFSYLLPSWRLTEYVPALTQESILTGSLNNGLYSVPLPQSSSRSLSYLTRKSTRTSEEWHRTLNHLSLSRLSSASSMVDGLTLQCPLKHMCGCAACLISKSKHQPHPLSSSRATRPGQYIVADTKHFSNKYVDWQGNQYFVVFLDIYTGESHVELYATKSSLAAITVAFLKKVTACNGLPVARVALIPL